MVEDARLAILRAAVKLALDDLQATKPGIRRRSDKARQTLEGAAAVVAELDRNHPNDD